MAEAKKQVNKKEIEKTLEERVDTAIGDEFDEEAIEEFKTKNFSYYETIQKLHMKRVQDFYSSVLIPMVNGELSIYPRLGSKFNKEIGNWEIYRQWVTDNEMINEDAEMVRSAIANLIHSFEDLFGMDLEKYPLWTRDKSYRELHYPFAFTDPADELF